MKYQHLKSSQRYEIAAYLKCSKSQKFIAEQLGVSESCISRELKRNNIENFDFRYFKFATMQLSDELGVDLTLAKIYRLDIGANIQLKYEVSDYFAELFYLAYYQRDNSKKSTLRFYGNSTRNTLIFYDKILEFMAKNRKLIKDDTSLIDTFGNLMRYEFMIQSNPSKVLSIPDLRVCDLFEPENCKKALKSWYNKYFNIEKKAVLNYPSKLKGLTGFERFMKRFIVQTMGWERLNFLMKKAVKQKCISASDKSKKPQYTTKNIKHKISVN